MSEHLDLDGLADVLAGADAPPHLTGCAGCAAQLAELRTASDAVTTELAGLPAPALPAEVARRLDQPWPASPTAATVTTATDARDLTSTTAPTNTMAPTILPRQAAPSRTSRRWLPAAAALLVVLAGAGYGISRLAGSGGSASSTRAAAANSAAAPAINVVRNSTGTDYTGRAGLAAAVPTLLSGSTGRHAGPGAPLAPQGAAGTTNPRVGADPLARLRDNAGLAECLLALLPPDDPAARPLALDYASYRGQPALVVLLPSTMPNKLDVFVVGPGCSRANDSTLFYTSVAKPS